jgi:hypothetical protein
VCLHTEHASAAAADGQRQCCWFQVAPVGPRLDQQGGSRAARHVSTARVQVDTLPDATAQQAAQQAAQQTQIYTTSLAYQHGGHGRYNNFGASFV